MAKTTAKNPEKGTVGDAEPRARPAQQKRDEGTWIDVYSLHFPPPEPTHKGPLREDLGLDGYDRKAGVEVPTKPVLKGKGDKEPKADPFAKKH